MKLKKDQKVFFFSIFPQTSVKKELLAKAAEVHVDGFRKAMAGEGKRVSIYVIINLVEVVIGTNLISLNCQSPQFLVPNPRV